MNYSLLNGHFFLQYSALFFLFFLKDEAAIIAGCIIGLLLVGAMYGGIYIYRYAMFTSPTA